jgi:hypothetical protein
VDDVEFSKFIESCIQIDSLLNLLTSLKKTISFNTFNKFSIEPSEIQCPLFVFKQTTLSAISIEVCTLTGHAGNGSRKLAGYG